VTNLAYTVSDTLVLAKRSLLRIPRQPDLLVGFTVQPIMFVLLFAYVFGGAIHVTGGSYREYIIGGILVQSLAFGLVGPATSIATDLTEGVIDRFRSLPAQRSAYLLGHYLAELAGMILSVAVLLGAGLLVGWRTHADPLHVLAALGLLLYLLSLDLGQDVDRDDSALARCRDGRRLRDRVPTNVPWHGLRAISHCLTVGGGLEPHQHVGGGHPRGSSATVAPITKHTWPLDHPVVASLITCGIVLAFSVSGSLRRYRARTTD
jgi:hypothetical protein